ncbi:hypothetical protein [Paraburkholderia sp. SIMBA_054]|uniref:hypothetical protein n=1 Tax=Paraburkholderia sp. SIMBA_054 TaxID=3085795 RepID=UPI003979D862
MEENLLDRIYQLGRSIDDRLTILTLPIALEAVYGDDRKAKVARMRVLIHEEIQAHEAIVNLAASNVETAEDRSTQQKALFDALENAQAAREAYADEHPLVERLFQLIKAI